MESEPAPFKRAKDEIRKQSQQRDEHPLLKANIAWEEILACTECGATYSQPYQNQFWIKTSTEKRHCNCGQKSWHKFTWTIDVKNMVGTYLDTEEQERNFRKNPRQTFPTINRQSPTLRIEYMQDMDGDPLFYCAGQLKDYFK